MWYEQSETMAGKFSMPMGGGVMPGCLGRRQKPQDNWSHLRENDKDIKALVRAAQEDRPEEDIGRCCSSTACTKHVCKAAREG